MSQYLLYQIQSNEPTNYGEITFEPIIPWNTERIEYCIKSVNTYANFLITTHEDFIEFDINMQCRTVKFEDRINYEQDELATVLTGLFEKSGITVETNLSGVLIFKASQEFSIINASHRVKLLLGLYDVNLPLKSKNNIIKSPSSPLVSFGNVLYLQSLQGTAIGTRVDKNYYSSPVIYRINTFIKSGLPVISNKKQDKVITNTDAAKQIKVRLVDFKFEPVICLSPLFITIKIKPVKKE